MSNIYANKSTASRELGKLGIPKEMRAELIVGEHAPFEINEKEVKKVLKALKAGKVVESTPVEKAVTEMFEADRKNNAVAVEDALMSANMTPVAEQTDVQWEEQRAELETVKAEAEPVKAKEPTVRKSNPRQNGKSRPSKGVCCAIWDELDKFVVDFNGQVPTPAQAQEMGKANNWNKVTVYRQFNDWKVYHGHK